MTSLTKVKLVLAISLIFLSIACKRKGKKELLDCSTTIETASTNGLTFNIDIGSPHLGEDVVLYELAQTITRFNFAQCGEDVGSVILTLHNTTNNRITFNYTLTARNREKIELWRYSNVFTLDPKMSKNVGEISKSTYSIENGSTSFGGKVENVLYQ